MAAAGDTAHGRRLRALIVVLWRAGLRIHEALALTESDLDARRGALLVRRGECGRRREVGMDGWAWDELEPWLEFRGHMPVGPLFCVITGPTRGRAWSSAAIRTQLRRVAERSGVHRRFAPHQLRHAHAVEMLTRASGSSSSSANSATATGASPRYLQGIDNAEIMYTVHARRPPMVPVEQAARSVAAAYREFRVSSEAVATR